MTEREKRIEEMFEDISKQCDLHELDDKCKFGDCDSCKIGLLYDAGYRKADEVRKETIKEVARYIDEEKGFCGFGVLVAKHFGVEVSNE